MWTGLDRANNAVLLLNEEHDSQQYSPEIRGFAAVIYCQAPAFGRSPSKTYLPWHFQPPAEAIAASSTGSFRTRFSHTSSNGHENCDTKYLPCEELVQLTSKHSIRLITHNYQKCAHNNCLHDQDSYRLASGEDKVRSLPEKATLHG